MSHRLSKEELDEQFEQFLKESLSDDSFDSNKKSVVLENPGKHKVKKTKKKDASPWWITEDDSDDGANQPRSYLKQKKQKSRLTTDADDSGFNDRNKSVPSFRSELARTSRSFLKSQSTSQPIEEVEEEEHVEEMQKSIDPLITSIEKDSLEIDDSVLASGPNQTFPGVGLDTLEEQEEKERFFARLEKGASSTIDYSKLIKELDSTDSTQLTTYMRNNNHAQADESEHRDESKDVSESKKVHFQLLSFSCFPQIYKVNYSEDFEDEPELNGHLVKKSEENDDPVQSKSQTHYAEVKHGMLDKVLLIDSMDSTIDTQKILQQTQDETESVMPQGTNEAMGTGFSNPYTNSDMEALHQAYKNLDSCIKDTEEQTNYLKVTENTITSYEHAIDSKENSLDKVLAGNSDISTVDELMLRIREEEGYTTSSLNIDTNKGVLPYVLHKPKEEDLKKTLEEVSQYNTRTSNDFPAHELDIHYKSKTNMVNQNEEQPTAFKKPSHSEMFALYSGERSDHADNHVNYPAVSTAPPGLIHKNHPNKVVKSPTSFLRKGQNAHYSYVKSSGYGKKSIQIKQTSNDDSLTSKELHTEIKWKSPTDRKQKDVLSATKSIRFAENQICLPKDNMKHQETAARINLAKSEEKLTVPVGTNETTCERYKGSEIHYSDVCGNDLTILQRLQNVEEKLNAGHVKTVHFKEDSVIREQEFKQEIEQMKINYEKEIKELKQENFILQTKLHAGEEKIKQRSHLLDQTSPITEENIQQIKRDILEQETLLHGYQQENERLYNQVKDLQAKNKENEQQMFQENQALKAELNSLREKVNSTKMHNQYTGSQSDHNTERFKDLATELSAIQKRESNLLEDIASHKKDKQALEVDLLQMKKERDLLKSQLANILDDKSYEIRIMEESYKKEITRLNKRLQWYAENQDILDKDAGRLKDAYEQIENLKLQVEKLRHDDGNQTTQQQNRLKDRAADAKRIQDLERQVKEMEAIIKRRHPNSIPAILFAAAAVSETEKPSKSSTVVYLERRIQKLENDLEIKDEDAKKSLRSMEQHFHKVKIQYESRINELEELLAQRPLNEPQKNSIDNTVKVKALEQELSIFKDAHHTTVMNLQKETEALKAKNLVLEHKLMLKEGNTKSNRNLEDTPDQARMTRLSEELVSKNKEIQELSKTVERLQKERMMMLSVKPNSSSVSNRIKHSGPSAGVLPLLSGSTIEKEYFPDVRDNTLYKPDTFTDYISDLQQQNKKLETEILMLSQDKNQQMKHLETSLANAEYAIKRLKDEAAAQVAALKQSHQRELEKLICQQALEHSSSRVAELTSKVSTQEILIKHLQKKVVELQKDRETLAVLRLREETLQNEMAKLLDELKMAKECQSPEMKHFLKLENKIKHMEIRHSQRELELQQINDQTRHVAESTQVKEIEEWKRLVQQKNTELEKFRKELDAILDVLRMLQKQGVVIPASSSEIY
ncbi:centrosomal protein of 162 kDa isoform X3 [Hyla sarda]|nr:centrosomal protein of 162 kDa isoform X3 [Hyla sarda]XP_056421976.1 centrosomal protein of 162 kDa isoform X3 [Hyla sarda]XP_056421982.1 centrosomal protein of 162 kDa isoform X3 [Hyla sarda]